MSDAVASNAGSGLRWVLGGAAAVSIAMGVAAYWRYAGSERYVAAGIEQMQQRGPGLDVAGCIDAVIGWHHDCDIQGTNAAVCQQAVGITMFHCLRGADRAQECEAFAASAEAGEASGKWVYATCEARGMRCVNKRECACADAYRAVDSFCRTGGEAVQL